MTELARAGYRTLAQKLQQDANVTFPPVLVTMLDGLEAELRCGEISAANQQWLAQCGLTTEQMARQLEPVYTPLRKLHLYHCDHRGLPLALIHHDGRVAWQAEYDAWGNVLREDNPEGLEQLIRLPGQQYDTETGLCYNRHRYYDPVPGRYITQDPIGLQGGVNPYAYPLNPVIVIDPLGLNGLDVLGNWLNQAGVKEVCNNAVAQYENSIPKPTSNWIFTGWDVNKGRRFGNGYVNVNATCKDQFNNTKSVNARTFQTGWFPMNEVEAGRGIPDPGEDSSDIASATENNVDNMKELIDAHSMAVKCGSMSGYKCFMDTDATSVLGRKLCGQR
ncbi:TPA: RHS repeat protein, partial [Enterobacter asburiae]|nr:RHS repeat protein [Enterobacter asburiae]